MSPLVKLALLTLVFGLIWAVQAVQTPRVPKAIEPATVSPRLASNLIDINTATAEELEALPGIGPKLAGAIVQYRDKQGGFQTLEQIKEVKGIGEKKYESISGLLTLNE